MSKFIRRVACLLTLLVGLGIAGATVLLSCARVETTAHGAPMRLRIPLLVADAVIPITVATQARASLPGFLDGPIVRRGDDDTWSAQWFCQDHAVQAQGRGDIVRIDCDGRRHAFALVEATIPAAVGPMPAQVAVLSDLEGNAAFLDKALQALGIVDAMGNWHYGTGHLVILGDSVDRGRGVFAVLWRLHALAAQAEAAGGAVHVLLGNHEQYMLRTNPARANREHLHALNAMGGYRQAFAADTVIGNWLRRQPVMIRLGDVLFTHGGISPQVAASGLSIAQLNRAMRGYWQPSLGHAQRSTALDAVLGPDGVTQYRGYVKAMDGRYPRASDADVELGLKRLDARRIVVAHTIVGRIQRLYDDRVIAVDVNDNDAAPEALVFEHGAPRVVDIGIHRNLPAPPRVTMREFSLANPADRAMLLAMYRDLRRLSALPYPY